MSSFADWEREILLWTLKKCLVYWGLPMEGPRQELRTASSSQELSRPTASKKRGPQSYSCWEPTSANPWMSWEADSFPESPDENVQLDFSLKNLQKRPEDEWVCSRPVCGNLWCSNRKQIHFSLRELKLGEPSATVRELISGSISSGIQTKVCPQIWILNHCCFPTDKHE